MAAAEQAVAPAEEMAEAVAPVAESRQRKKAAALKEKKKPAKGKDQKASHPPYFQMIKEALMALQDKSGSSAYAIAKYMEEKHKSELPANFRKILSLQLKNSTAKGKLVKVRASFKLSELGKKAAGGAKAKVAPAKPAKAEKKKARKPETKKVGGKRSRKAKPKQPKSIKSPAAKKAKKATAAA